MKKQDILNLIDAEEALSKHVEKILKEVNKINSDKYWTVPESGTFFVRFHNSKYENDSMCSIISSYMFQHFYDIPVRWLWTPIEEIKNEVSSELKEYIANKTKAEIEEYESAIKEFQNRLKLAKNELKKLK